MWHIVVYESHAAWVSKTTRAGVYLYWCVHQYENIVGMQRNVISKRCPGLLTAFITPSSIVLQKTKYIFV